MVQQTMGLAKTIERGHGRVAELLWARYQARLVAHGLRAEGDIAETAEMAEMPAIRDTFRSRSVTEHGEDGIVVDACAPPGQYAVGGRDHHAVNPRTLGPRGRESDRLGPFRIRVAVAERITCFQVGVPVDLREVSGGILRSTAHRACCTSFPLRAWLGVDECARTSISSRRFFQARDECLGPSLFRS